MIKTKSGDAIAKGLGIVRDKDGNPSFPDYNNIPPQFEPHLTAKDKLYIEGMKR